MGREGVMVLRRIGRLEHERTEDIAERVGDEQDRERRDFLGLPGCVSAQCLERSEAWPYRCSLRQGE